MSKKKTDKAIGASTPKVSPNSLANLKPAWGPGQSGNPKGRTKGSRQKLGEDFLTALHADFAEHGEKVIETVRTEKPAEYLKVVAGVLPKELNVNANPIQDLTDDELAAAIAAIQSFLGSQAAHDGSDQETKH